MRRPGRPATVRGRTALTACLGFGLVLAVAAFAAHALARRALVSDVDGVAQVRASDVAALIAAGRLPSSLSSPDGELVWVVGVDGTVLARTPGAGATPPSWPAARNPSRQGSARLRSTHATLARAGAAPLRVATLATPSGGTVVVATDLGPSWHRLATFERVLAFGVPVLLVLVVGAAWLAAGRALRPVAAISAEVADISAGDLHRRVPEPSSADEIGRLARTVNDMLDRLERSSGHERAFVGDASESLAAPLREARARLESSPPASPGDGPPAAEAEPGPPAAEAEPGPPAAEAETGQPWPALAAHLLRAHRRMEGVVRDLLHLAREEAGGSRAPRVPLDLDDVVRGEVARLRIAHLSASAAGGPVSASAAGGPVRDAGSGLTFDTRAVSAAPLAGRREDLRRAVRDVLELAERKAATTVTVRLDTTVSGDVILEVEADGPPAAEATPGPPAAEATPGPPAADRLGLAVAAAVAAAHGGVLVREETAHGLRLVLRLPAS